MESRNTEVLRRFYEAWNAWDVDGMVAVFHPRVEVWPLMVPLVSSEVYHGHDGVRRWLTDLDRRFERVSVQCEQILEAGEEVIGVLRVTARNDGSDLEARLANVCRLEDGLIIEFEGRDADEALEELG